MDCIPSSSYISIASVEMVFGRFTHARAATIWMRIRRFSGPTPGAHLEAEELHGLPALNTLGISSPFEIPQFTDYKTPESMRSANTYVGSIRIVDVIGTVSVAHLSATSGYRLAKPRLSDRYRRSDSTRRLRTFNQTISRRRPALPSFENPSEPHLIDELLKILNGDGSK
ncbi:hypothetical protein DL89DRAFT_321966 [Linderina pennispora]|uniref:Uncharacterized protein n=1 Tax=Linderina pennispora TaxID=61395 RepID=A0A1Y1WAB7_9FUNG|nr:uncharacterized protein DL89DRAFT_321966 [Linderina pennispora]ORX70479.1 hypothetical protein DL89DRAFT_321966 [Linderina pennispora]